MNIFSHNDDLFSDITLYLHQSVWSGRKRVAGYYTQSFMELPGTFHYHLARSFDPEIPVWAADVCT